MVAVLITLVFASATIGSRAVGLHDIIAALGGSTDGFDQAAVATRLPRTLLALVAGAALAVSGAVMQGVTRNPLADPGILGVNMGAALAVVSGITYFGFASATSFVWVAIFGAAVTATFVYAVGSLRRGGATPLKLALAGAVTSAALVSPLILPANNSIVADRPHCALAVHRDKKFIAVKHSELILVLNIQPVDHPSRYLAKSCAVVLLTGVFKIRSHKESLLAPNTVTLTVSLALTARRGLTGEVSTLISHIAAVRRHPVIAPDIRAGLMSTRDRLSTHPVDEGNGP